MQRNSYALAALAVAAVPGLVPQQTTTLTAPLEGLECAGVVGEDGRRVIVTAPVTAAAGAALEQDLHVSESLLGTSLRAVVPPVLGSVKLPDGGRASVTAAPDGIPLTLDAVSADSALARSLGGVIARIHAVPRYAAEATGAETFSAEMLREGHLQRCQRAQEAELLPTAVAQRWEHLLEDDELWNHSSQFVHGDLSEDALFFDGDRVRAVRDWSSAHIGDPAQDLAWLITGLDSDSFDAVYAGYRQELPTVPHPRLMERAQALGEFAVLSWLLHGVDAEDEEIIADAQEMLADLDHDLAQLAREQAERTYDDMDVNPS